MQDLRHQGSVPDHQLGHARGWGGAELLEPVMRPSGRQILAIAVVLAVGACARDDAPAQPIVSAAQRDKQAIDAASLRERAYQAALAKGDLAFLGGCAPGADESIRLVETGSGNNGYSLAIVPDKRGAVAIWQGLQHVGNGKYSAYGPHGMRLDVNGWRQLRQALVEPDFAMDAQSVAEPAKVLRAYPETFIAYCLDGHAFVAVAPPAAADERLGFERSAVTMRRLAGNYYSPPAN
ncbi:MAG: hypothetical protein ACREO3_04325 [Arenimonas sp.]